MRVGERIRSKVVDVVVVVVVVDQLEAGWVGSRGLELDIILLRTRRAVNYLGSRCPGHLELSGVRFQFWVVVRGFRTY